ncbi:MAG: tetratricopeptide repeat protein [Planctomycetota bacterium]
MDTHEQGCRKCRFQSYSLSLTIGIITLLLYLPAARFDFIHLDDFHYVAENPFIESGFSLQNLFGVFTASYASNWHPLTWLSHMLDYELFGLNPGGYHIVNALIHTANSILLFLVLRCLTGATWKSFFVAALFAWHPLHVESVAWISERKDVLFTFFWILTLWSHWRYAKKPCAKRNLLTLLFCCLALMSKPMAVTLPIVLLLMDIWPLKRFGQPIETGSTLKRQFGRLILEKISLFIAVLFACALTFIAQQRSGAVKGLDHLSILPRLSNAFISYLSYLRMMAWPVDLAVIYPHAHHLRPVTGILCAAIFLAITVWALRTWKKYPVLAVGWLWYIITLVPVIGIVQVGVQAMADRYTYIPLIGLFIMIAWGVELFVNKRPSLKPVVLVGLCIAFAACLYTTRLQIHRWKNSLTLFTHALSVTEENWKAQSALGCWYFDQGNYDKSQECINNAIHINPENEFLRVRLGLTFTEQGKTAPAMEQYQEAIRINPNSSTAYYYMGTLYGERDNPEKMLSCYRKALAIVPGSRKAKNLIAWTLSTYPDEMIRDGQEALQLCGKLSFLEKPDAEYLCVLAAAYAEVGQIKKAILIAEQALEEAKTKKDINGTLIRKINTCLEQYKQGQAYRDMSPLID